MSNDAVGRVLETLRDPCPCCFDRKPQGFEMCPVCGRTATDQPARAKRPHCRTCTCDECAFCGGKGCDYCTPGQMGGSDGSRPL